MQQLINKIRDNIYIGNYRDALDENQLKENEITAVLNVAYEVNDTVYHVENIRYVKVGLADNNKNLKYMKTLAVSVLGGMLAMGEVVFVHCGAGFSRSVYVISKYLSLFEKIDIHDAYEDVRKHHFVAMYGPLFEGEGLQLSDTCNVATGHTPDKTGTCKTCGALNV